MTFDRVIMVDWSGGNDRGARPVKDAIWACIAAQGRTEDPVYLRNRQVAEDWLTDTLDQCLAAGHRVLLGFDLCFAYPAGFATQLIGREDTLALWDWFAERVQDSPTQNNRFDLAGEINAQFPGVGPFWFNGLQRDIPNLPRRGRERDGHGLNEKRAADLAIKGSFSPWQLAGAGAVGGQVIMGFPVLSRLRHRFAGRLTVWPFQPPDGQIVMAETYFSMLPDLLKANPAPIRDATQVALYARAFSLVGDTAMARLFDVESTQEGWVLAAGEAEVLRAALAPSQPLANDCFALPQGTYWTPVEDALAHLETHLQPVTEKQATPLSQAAGRILATDVIAARAHPPAPNAAVDGYGLAGPAPAGPVTLGLVQGRSAAGAPYAGTVPAGQAIRILTGANLPAGVDTVVLQEDVQATESTITLQGPLRQGANARKAGEDMQAGQTILHAGRRLTAGDIGMIATTGLGQIDTFAALRVGILSTGDELVAAGVDAHDGQIYDANGPMLHALVAGWGHETVTLGRAPDDRARLRGMLDDAATQCDVILTSGGASAGTEDHISALLADTGSFALWRIAMKPGRPLALGMWNGTPVFGLPGNPVAAMVCALVFAAPALRLMAGGGWSVPQGYMLPAAFEKSKKDGRTEYLRARVNDGKAEVFASEGSGRVTGLSWATGLVALDRPAQTIGLGDPVRYIPFADFGA